MPYGVDLFRALDGNKDLVRIFKKTAQETLGLG
jgi:hypothetical protein